MNADDEEEKSQNSQKIASIITSMNLNRTPFSQSSSRSKQAVSSVPRPSIANFNIGFDDDSDDDFVETSISSVRFNEEVPHPVGPQVYSSTQLNSSKREPLPKTIFRSSSSSTVPKTKTSTSLSKPCTDDDYIETTRSSSGYVSPSLIDDNEDEFEIIPPSPDDVVATTMSNKRKSSDEDENLVDSENSLPPPTKRRFVSRRKMVLMSDSEDDEEENSEALNADSKSPQATSGNCERHVFFYAIMKLLIHQYRYVYLDEDDEEIEDDEEGVDMSQMVEEDFDNSGAVYDSGDDMFGDKGMDKILSEMENNINIGIGRSRCVTENVSQIQQSGFKNDSWIDGLMNKLENGVSYTIHKIFY